MVTKEAILKEVKKGYEPRISPFSAVGAVVAVVVFIIGETKILSGNIILKVSIYILIILFVLITGNGTFKRLKEMILEIDKIIADPSLDTDIKLKKIFYIIFVASLKAGEIYESLNTTPIGGENDTNKLDNNHINN